MSEVRAHYPIIHIFFMVSTISGFPFIKGPNNRQSSEQRPITAHLYSPTDPLNGWIRIREIIGSGSTPQVRGYIDLNDVSNKS